MGLLAATSPTFHLHLPWWTWVVLAGVGLLGYVEREQRAARKARHRAYLRGPEWRKRRKAALERAGQRCQDCGRGSRLHVHHLTYKRWGNEADHDLRVLCSQCHLRRHRDGGRFDDLLDRVVASAAARRSKSEG